MDSIVECGAQLKALREQKGLSLRDIEKGTSIRLSYLKAIEEGQIEDAITPIYVHGFVRQYAQFLQMDMEQLASQYPEIFQAKAIPTEFAYGIGTLEMRGTPHGGVRFLPNRFLILGALVVIALGYGLGKLFGIL